MADRMNDFDQQIVSVDKKGLYASGIDTIQVNVGLQCNQNCVHCHMNAGPGRSEMMNRETMVLVLGAADRIRPALVDVTGGAPEMNPHLRKFIRDLRSESLPVQVRTNLTVLLEPGMEDMPAFLREHNVGLVGSLPCYLEENVRAQRGAGVYESSIESIRRLNALGYGIPEGLQLNLVYNPGGPSLPPDQSSLEEAYRKELRSRFGVEFTHLLTITNMPIGRFLDDLRRGDRADEYFRLLREAFNPETIEGLMCRRQISVGWDGTLYDCDFNLALGCPVDHGVADHIRELDPAALEHRRIVTGAHCFGCTAGCGSSCRGALT